MKFEETVLLIDVAFLNRVIEDVRFHFTRKLGRELKVLDLSELISYIALDGGLKPHPGNKVQVLLIYDDLSGKLYHTFPADVKSELNNVAFQNEIGEFTLYSFSPEGFVAREDLFFESAQLILSEKEVKRLWMVVELKDIPVGFPDKLREKDSGKEMILFGMDSSMFGDIHVELLGLPVIQALGIRSDELE